MSANELVSIAMILMLGTAVQAAVGFGAGMVSVPLLVWTGVSLPQAVGLTLSGVIVQTAFNCWQNRSELPWRGVVPVMLVRAAALPVGVWLMYVVSGMDASRVRQVIGVVLLVILLAQAGLKVPPREHLHWGWMSIAAFLSGLLAGLVGMGAAPIAMWVMAHDWHPSRQRAFLWLTFISLIPLHAALLCLTFGKPLIAAMIAGAVLTPAGLGGALLGGELGGRLSRSRLRLAMSALLIVMALQSILDFRFSISD